MKGCGDYSATIHTGLDKALSGPDLEDFLAHLTGCVTCRAELEAEESLSSLLQRSRPLYTAPDTLRARIIQAAQSLHAPVPFTKRIASVFSRPLHTSARRALIRPAFVAAILVAIAASLVVSGIVRQSSANSYVEAAIAAHRGLVAGSLPLEVQSGSPSEVTAWFAGKVPFNFRLPSSHEQSGVEQVYRLIGGRLVNYKDGYVALVAYQMGQQKISLLVSSSSSAASAGGEEIRAGGILFHYSKEENLNVVTWSNHGLTYALVSSLPGSARQSCLVCHQNLADRAQSSAHWGQQVSVPMRVTSIPQITLVPRIQMETETQVVSADGTDCLKAIETRKTGGRVIRRAADVLFVMIGADAVTHWLPAQLQSENGYVLTGREVSDQPGWTEDRAPFLLETNLPGFFCVGDIRYNSIKRVSSSVGEGSMAIAFVHQFPLISCAAQAGAFAA